MQVEKLQKVLVKYLGDPNIVNINVKIGEGY